MPYTGGQLGRSPRGKMSAVHSRLPLSRRQFLQGAGVAGLGLVVGCGQQSFWTPQSPKAHRIGYLSPNLNAVPLANLAAFRQGLADLGYVEGHNVIIESRHAD